jgi:hypothetical protein
MKTILTALLPVAMLAAIVGFAVGTPTTAQAADISPVAHTESRFCGSHHHHHGHYWSCGGYTYYCCGH